MDLEYRLVAFKCLEPVCSDGQLLMDLYVNYDCDPDRTETVLLERMFKGLITTINHPDGLADPSMPGPMTPYQRNTLRYGALACITRMLNALFSWYNEVGGSGAPGGLLFPALSHCSFMDP